MSFWRSETLEARASGGALISDFRSENIKHGAYELALGPEAIVTTEMRGAGIVDRLSPGESLVIPPGQFALLLTEERVSVPADAIAFISIKAKIKFEGLVNVSGFHVDPGWSDSRLKFSVYNAGSKDIVLARGRPTFLLWYASLDESTEDLYDRNTDLQNEITSEDQMRMQDRVASPPVLADRMDELENRLSARIGKLEIHRSMLVALLVSLVGAVAVLIFQAVTDSGGAPVQVFLGSEPGRAEGTVTTTSEDLTAVESNSSVSENDVSQRPPVEEPGSQRPRQEVDAAAEAVKAESDE